jgi:hypothetical protein
MTPWGVALVVAVWIAIGLGTAVVLSRRGHEFGPHAALGVVLGPVFVFLALDIVRRREHDQPIQISSSTRSGGRRVLVVAVGDVEDPGAALESLRVLLGDFGPITLAVPVEHEVAERVHRMNGAPPPSEKLDRIANALADRSPGRMLLPGRIDEAISIGVRETDADIVLLVGAESSTAAPGLEDRLDVVVVRADETIRPDSASS